MAASILAGVGVLWAGMSMGLPGIYLGIFLQYGILAIRYIRQKKGKNDVVSEGLGLPGLIIINLKEKQIHVAEQRITKPVEQQFHEQTEIYYDEKRGCR